MSCADLFDTLLLGLITPTLPYMSRPIQVSLWFYKWNLHPTKNGQYWYWLSFPSQHSHWVSIEHINLHACTASFYVITKISNSNSPLSHFQCGSFFLFSTCHFLTLLVQQPWHTKQVEVVCIIVDTLLQYCPQSLISGLGHKDTWEKQVVMIISPVCPRLNVYGLCTFLAPLLLHEMRLLAPVSHIHMSSWHSMTTMQTNC